MGRGQRAAFGRDHDSDGSLHVEAGEALALRGQEDERLGEAGKRGVAHLLAHPCQLAAEIGVGIDRHDGDHLGLVGGTDGGRAGDGEHADEGGATANR